MKAVILAGGLGTRLSEETATRPLAEGYILTCCRSILGDVEIAVADLGPLADIEVQTLPCRIDSLVELASDVIEVTLRLPPNSPLDFVAGQHINVIGENGVRRSYSLANFPREDGKLVLHIRKVLKGVMSEYWFSDVKVNDLLRLEGPLGTFSLRDVPSSRVIFLATGTGIAPVKAMLEELNTNPSSVMNKPISVYWGGRVQQDIYWAAEFERLDCEFTPVLSRAEPTWQGRTGYVQSALFDDGVELSSCAVYACGSADMIHSAREKLVKAGLPMNNFYSDAFVSSD